MNSPILMTTLGGREYFHPPLVLVSKQILNEEAVCPRSGARSPRPGIHPEVREGVPREGLGKSCQGNQEDGNRAVYGLVTHTAASGPWHSGQCVSRGGHLTSTKGFSHEKKVGLNSAPAVRKETLQAQGLLQCLVCSECAVTGSHCGGDQLYILATLSWLYQWLLGCIRQSGRVQK